MVRVGPGQDRGGCADGVEIPGCRFQPSDPDHVVGHRHRIHDDRIELGGRRSIGERGARGGARSPPDDDALRGRRLKIWTTDEGLGQRGHRYGHQGHQHGDPHTETRWSAKRLVECRHQCDPSVDIISVWIDPRAFLVGSDERPDSKTGQGCDADHRSGLRPGGAGFHLGAMARRSRLPAGRSFAQTSSARARVPAAQSQDRRFRSG